MHPNELRMRHWDLCRPWEGGDRVRNTAMTSVFLDLFVIRRYGWHGTMAGLQVVVVVKTGCVCVLMCVCVCVCATRIGMVRWPSFKRSLASRQTGSRKTKPVLL